ncbi:MULTISPECIES: 2-amino-4-hydroxy-6-hydroxymethyldihydropteridine diphosphokinase [Thiorhodovibrio]|uniref:2-amino-4-hydroxy-6- hydroxymethyldihydropteridine diphosphokinase n=1 Tax=Thiorhodovibrio TaxID=61593 RepID=UPI0019143E68|nr:2-amino-4-hydroxy-6-hydroxymethyldihydropteridine diphosphokinase [Thiorhodovibrio litoralis]MBK5970607.1 2-amino-4-hydroxy-6-hydroxymethyldihydropteridine diphosphokinase [Thiorhodovibrio winogradskyi]WPL12768.1 2-amino-4-hydroxy-6-hydroxymethyldihydropteridine pyrophosphokinase [Thiorhodovibrio litoralis]
MRCWIGVGSNLRREPSIRGGLHDLQRRFGSLRISPVYETEAVGSDGPPFLNLVVGIETRLAVSAINALLHAIEDEHGRVRDGDRFAPRTLDLDLLTYGAMAGEIEGYRVPRAEVLDYAFVLAPLAAAAPQELHPELGQSYADLWRDFDLAARGQAAPIEQSGLFRG